ncbi:hypothetical protein B0H34DRAFT_316529 [Crassisporium funariophilum]|nr:hypothetical protein B0H34DRAFT_316529 [Crassisporium funariophilum]
MQRLSQVLSASCLRARPISQSHTRHWLGFMTNFPASSFTTIPNLRVNARTNHTHTRVRHLLPQYEQNVMSKATESSSKATPSIEDRWARQSKDAHDRVDREPPANAYSGRSVPVLRGDLGMAFKNLDGILMRNKVRQQLRLTERHEKKGVKRRRLQSERWRRQFANEVRKKVELVIKIRNRGA